MEAGNYLPNRWITLRKEIKNPRISYCKAKLILVLQSGGPSSLVPARVYVYHVGDHVILGGERKQCNILKMGWRKH